MCHAKPPSLSTGRLWVCATLNILASHLTTLATIFLSIGEISLLLTNSLESDIELLFAVNCYGGGFRGEIVLTGESWTSV